MASPKVEERRVDVAFSQKNTRKVFKPFGARAPISTRSVTNNAQQHVGAVDRAGRAAYAHGFLPFRRCRKCCASYHAQSTRSPLACGQTSVRAHYGHERTRALQRLTQHSEIGSPCPGFFAEQPADQLERWLPMIDNGTHLVIAWRADPRLCGRNVTEYFVQVTTSTPVLNFFIGRFGSFPQDLCVPGGSKAREAVAVEEESHVCSPYEAWCSRKQRRTAFEIPATLIQLLNWDIEVTVRAYGSHAPIGRPRDAIAASWWPPQVDGAADPSSHVQTTGQRPPGPLFP